MGKSQQAKLNDTKAYLYFEVLVLRTLSERIFLIDNIALGKPVKVSTIFQDYTPERAVDGNLNGDMLKGGCAHTQLEQDPLLRVDLQQRYLVQQVRKA